MANTIHDTTRLETARDGLLRAADLLQAVIDGKTSQSRAGARLGLTPQQVNQQLAAQFTPYIKKTIRRIDIAELCKALKDFRTPADRFMLEIFEHECSEDPDVIDILPEYDEEKFWEVAEATLTPSQFRVMAALTGKTTGSPMTMSGTAEYLHVSAMYVSNVKRSSVWKMRRPHVLERILPNESLHLIEWTEPTMQKTAKIIQEYDAAKTAYEAAHPMELATQAFLEDRIPDEDVRRELGLVLTSEVEAAARTIPVVIPVKAAGFSERAANCLSRARVDTLNQLAEMPIQNIRKIRNSGKKTREEFYNVLKEKMSVDRPELLGK